MAHRTEKKGESTVISLHRDWQVDLAFTSKGTAKGAERKNINMQTNNKLQSIHQNVRNWKTVYAIHKNENEEEKKSNPLD